MAVRLLGLAALDQPPEIASQSFRPPVAEVTHDTHLVSSAMVCLFTHATTLITASTSQHFWLKVRLGHVTCRSVRFRKTTKLGAYWGAVVRGSVSEVYERSPSLPQSRRTNAIKSGCAVLMTEQTDQISKQRLETNCRQKFA